MTFALIALAIQQTALKDVHILATPLEKAVRKVGEIYGAPMDVSNLIKNQIVLIDASQVSAEEVRSQIAKAVNGTWEKKENIWHLTKTSQQQKQDLQREADIRIRFLKKTFEIRANAEGTKAEYNSTYARQNFNQFRNEAKNRSDDQMQPPGPTAAGYGLPNQRLMSRFLLKFGLDRISAIPNNSRVVFALAPNAMQRPLDINIQEEIVRFNKEQDLWSKTFMEMSKDQESQAKETRADSGGVAVARAVSSDDDQSYNYSFSNFPVDLANVYFTVYCSQEGTYDLKLIGIPRDSKQPHFSVSATTFEGAFAGMTADDFQIKPQPGFKLSQQSEDFKNYFFHGEGKIPSDRLKARLDQFADTATNDPLSYGLSESMIFDARREKKNIVACLSDSNINIFEPFFADTWFQDRFRIINEGIVYIEGKWICVRPFPFSEPNIPRVELRNIISRVRANGRVSIEDRASLAALRPRTNAYSYIEGMLGKFVGTSRDEYAEVDALKCVGLLSEPERSAAMRPTGVPFSQLNARLKQHLFECSYYNEHNRLWPIGGAYRDSPGYIDREPTLLAPTGILPDSIFQIIETSEDQIKDGDEPGSIGLMTNAKGWGSTMYQLDHPEEFPGNNFKFDTKRKLSRVRSRTWTLKLRVNAKCEWSSSMQTHIVIAKDAFTLETLPDDLKADFEAGYKENAEITKKRIGMQKKRNGGGGTTQQK